MRTIKGKMQVAPTNWLDFCSWLLPWRPEKIAKHFFLDRQHLFAFFLNKTIKKDDRTLKEGCQGPQGVLWKRLIKKSKVRESNQLRMEISTMGINSSNVKKPPTYSYFLRISKSMVFETVNPDVGFFHLQSFWATILGPNRSNQIPR